MQSNFYFYTWEIIHFQGWLGSAAVPDAASSMVFTGIGVDGSRAATDAGRTCLTSGHDV